MENLREKQPALRPAGRKRQAAVAEAGAGTDLVSSFSLAGSQWTVSLSPDINEMGYCDPEAYCIKIRANMSDQAKQATFYHELVHAVLFTMGQTNHNEEFVDTFGGFIHQFMTTKE